MADRIVSVAAGATAGSVPPPRRRRPGGVLGLDAVQVLTRLGLLPLAAGVVGLAAGRQHRLPAGPRGRGRPRPSSEASVLLLARLGRLWHLSTREVG